MRLLLDTHAYIWWAFEPDKLSPVASEALTQPSNEVLVSVVSLWEMAIKMNLGKLSLPVPLPELARRIEQSGVKTLPVLAPHVFAHSSLRGVHRDPFDRMLVAQAFTEGLTLVTRDPLVRQYGVAALW